MADVGGVVPADAENLEEETVSVVEIVDPGVEEAALAERADLADVVNLEDEHVLVALTPCRRLTWSEALARSWDD